MVDLCDNETFGQTIEKGFRLWGRVQFVDEQIEGLSQGRPYVEI